jgi:hypothetical protein
MKKRQRYADLDDFDPDLDISRYSMAFMCSFPFYLVNLYDVFAFYFYYGLNLYSKNKKEIKF